MRNTQFLRRPTDLDRTVTRFVQSRYSGTDAAYDMYWSTWYAGRNQHGHIGGLSQQQNNPPIFSFSLMKIILIISNYSLNQEGNKETASSTDQMMTHPQRLLMPSIKKSTSKRSVRTLPSCQQMPQKGYALINALQVSYLKINFTYYIGKKHHQFVSRVRAKQ